MNSSRALVLAEHEIAARQFQARLLVGGKVDDIAFEGQHALAGAAAVNGGDAEKEIEGRVAELVGVLLGQRIGASRIALVQKRLDVVGRRRRCGRGYRQHGQCRQRFAPFFHCCSPPADRMVRAGCRLMLCILQNFTNHRQIGMALQQSGFCNTAWRSR